MTDYHSSTTAKLHRHIQRMKIYLVGFMKNCYDNKDDVNDKDCDHIEDGLGCYALPKLIKMLLVSLVGTLSIKILKEC